MFGIVVTALFCISGIMIGTAWLFGAQFPNVFQEASLFLTKITNSNSSPSNPILSGREEL
ncbi:hypothetical protein E4U43_005224 [Claviceps pusilla]|uniref:Uncharacterized protein n=1 Tax=Claviceps pusilla TaxID=123648 RepID=A0A9P7N4H2_9HYPO|nr:hypothetical protein E4U43_005224 [Claviceps pusilla]